jgi:hypothetical protein
MKYGEANTEAQNNITAAAQKDFESIMKLQNSTAERVQQFLLTLSAGSFAVLVSLFATDLQNFVPSWVVIWFFYFSLLFAVLLLACEYF